MQDATFHLSEWQRDRLARPFSEDPLTGKPQDIGLLESRRSLTAAEPAHLRQWVTTCALDKCCSMAGSWTGSEFLVRGRWAT